MSWTSIFKTILIQWLCINSQITHNCWKSLKPFGSYRSIKKAQVQSIKECTQLAEAKTDRLFIRVSMIYHCLVPYRFSKLKHGTTKSKSEQEVSLFWLHLKFIMWINQSDWLMRNMNWWVCVECWWQFQISFPILHPPHISPLEPGEDLQLVLKIWTQHSLGQKKKHLKVNPTQAGKLQHTDFPCLG